MDAFEDKMLNDLGFDTQPKRDLRVEVLNTIHGNHKMWSLCWACTDAYGRAGRVPPQGYDWSGFRDSSYRAILAMATRIAEYGDDK